MTNPYSSGERTRTKKKKKKEKEDKDSNVSKKKRQEESMNIRIFNSSINSLGIGDSAKQTIPVPINEQKTNKQIYASISWSDLLFSVGST